MTAHTAVRTSIPEAASDHWKEGSTTNLSSRPPYEHDIVKRWTAEIAESDGFIFVTPEYNYGPPAVLRNALD